MRGSKPAKRKAGAAAQESGAISWAPFFAGHLEITTDLGSPTQFDVALIATIMLWPDDEEWRARAALSSFVEWIGDDTAGWPYEVLQDLQQITRRADPIARIQREVKKERYARGVLTGSILHTAIIANALDAEKKSMEHVVKQSVAGFVNAGHRVRAKTFNNEILPQFRSVAHFWAAAFKRLKIELRDCFPCRFTEFAEFLADAEAYRLAGGELRPPHSTNAVLRPGEAFPLSANLYVPPSTLLYDRLPNPPFPNI
jgi:hypothetical protein